MEEKERVLETRGAKGMWDAQKRTINRFGGGGGSESESRHLWQPSTPSPFHPASYLHHIAHLLCPPFHLLIEVLQLLWALGKRRVGGVCKGRPMTATGIAAALREEEDQKTCVHLDGSDLLSILFSLLIFGKCGARKHELRETERPPLTRDPSACGLTRLVAHHTH